MIEEKILERVRKLLDRANHPEANEHEREVCIAKADTLMLKHAIDQAVLDATKRDDRREPKSSRIHAYAAYGESGSHASRFQTILWYLAETYRCRVAMYTDGDVVVVGMPDDVDYFEMIWTNIYMGFISRLFPRWDNNIGLDANIYNFKRAGWKWIDIRQTALEHNEWIEWPDGGSMIRAYKRHAKAIGDTQQIKTQRFGAYRESYAEGFVRSICKRLEIVREDTEAAASASGSGAELALVDVNDRVGEAFYSQFEYLRPPSAADLAKAREQRRAQEQKEAEELQEMLDAMTPKQREVWDRKQEEQRRKDVKASDRYWRQMDREADARYDASGMAAGRASGNHVDIGGSKGSVGASTKGEIG